MGVMDRYEEKKKKRQETSNDKTTTMGVMERYELGVKGKGHKVTQDFINTFVDDTNNFLSNYSEGKEIPSFNVATSALKDLDSRKSAIQLWMERNKSYLDEESYKSLSKTLGDITSGLEGITSYYSNFENEEQFQSAIQYAKDREAKENADLKALQKEINDLVRQGASADEIAEKRAFYNEAEYIQNGIKLSSVANSATDYDTYNKYKGYEPPKGVSIPTGDESIDKKYGGDANLVYINDESQRDAIKMDYSMAYGVGSKSYREATENFDVYEKMTEDEVAIYNYYYNKHGKNVADEYFYSIQQELENRVANEYFDVIEGKAFLEMLFGVQVGLDQFFTGWDETVETIFGQDDDGNYIIQNAVQTAGGMAREDLEDVGFKVFGNSLGQIGYDALSTTANMLPSIIVSTVASRLHPMVGRVAGSLLLGGSAAGNAKLEMQRLGYTEEQANTYGLLVGASEAGLEFLLGGIGGFSGNGGIISKLGSKALSKVDNAFARVAIQLGGSMADEALEEGLQTILEPWFKSIATGVDYEAPNVDEVLYSSLLGAISAGLFEGGSTVAGEVNTYSQGKNLLKNGLSVESLTNFAKDRDYFSADSVAYRLAGKVNEKTGAYTIGRLFNEMNAQLTERNQNDIARALESYGMRSKDAETLANALAQVVAGAELTQTQKEMLENNPILAKVFKEVIIDENSTVNQRMMGLREAFQTKPTETSQEVTGEAKAVPVNENTSVAVSTENEAVKVSESGKTIQISTGKEINIKEIASIKDGEITLRTEEGETVNANDVEYGSKAEALIYENVVDMNLNAASANAFVRGYDPSEGLTVEEYAKGFREAYTYGQYSYPVQEMSSDGFSAKLSEDKKSLAYNLGKTDAKYKVAEKQKAISEKKGTASQKAKGKVHYEGDVNSLTDRQSASLKALETIADALGVEFHIFESEVENGKRKGANGWFDLKDGSIHIDLYAGLNGEGTILFTAAHELTHFIREWSPAKFKVFADFLLEQYGKKGISVDALVREQIAKAKRNGRDISYDTAYEEVIADSCEAMLADGDAITKIAKLKAKDKTLWQKIKDFITDLVAKIKKVYEGLKPDSIESGYVSKMLDVAEQLKALWTEALVDAGESYSEVKKALGEGSTIEVNEDGEFTVGQTKDGTVLYNDRTYDEGGRETLKTTLKAEGFSEADIEAALVIMDAKHELVKRLGKEFTAQDTVNKATLITDIKNGNSVLSALVKNGDYPVNIDLLTVCKKRQAYQRVISRLCETGLIEQATLDSLAIAEINKILGKHGFETACLGCFVESKRLRIQEYAQLICDEWNGLVDKKVGKGKAKKFGFSKETFVKDLTDAEVQKLTDEYEKAVTKEGNVNVGTGSYAKKFEKLMDSVPTLQKHLSISDIATPQGMANLKSVSPELFALVASRYGSGSPKPVQNFNPYNSELAKYGTKPKGYSSLREYLYAIGGARMQSFSDFIIENWFDYCQIVADLSAKKLPMHTYTKEIALAKLFGMTGIKVNMSLIPDIDRSLGKEYAGLTKNAKGEYELIFADKDRFKATGGKSYMQSINFADAVELQNDPRYSSNIGTIAIGISDKHIRMMLDDSRIRMIIPYHSSAINPIFANLAGIDYYKDYTDVQTTKVAYLLDSKGVRKDISLSASAKKTLTSGFEFNEQLQKIGDARATAQAYLDWCADASQHTITINGETYTAVLTPKFNDFSDHQNYYKLLEDFNAYDCITEQSAPQGDVQQIYPDNFENILRDELTHQENYRKKQDPKWETAMGEIESYLKKHTKSETKAYAKEHGIKLSDRDYLNAVNSGDMETAQKMVDEAAKKAGYTIKGNHGTVSFFNIFDRTYGNPEGDWGKGFYFTNNQDDVETNYANTEGADLTAKIERLAEQLEWQDEYADLDYDERLEIARKELIKGEPRVIKAYLKMENPVAIGGQNETFFDYNEEYNEETDEYGEPSGKLVDFVNALSYVLDDYDWVQEDPNDLFTEAIDYNGYTASELEKRAKELFMFVEDENGNLASNEIVRDAFEVMGFDGIIDSTVAGKFGSRSGRKNAMVGVDIDTTHYIVFKSSQIKQSDPVTYDDNGNIIPLSERFNTENNDIRYSDRDKTSYAPTFYSYMGKVVDGIKSEKVGAGGVVSYLKGKGVKNEEIKWSGIETWLEGKKSVTKKELQEFIRGSQLQIIEEASGHATFIDDDGNVYESEGAFKDKAYEIAEASGIGRERVKFTLDTDEGTYMAYVNNPLSGLILSADVETIDGSLGRWSQYKLDGGENYRELVFRMPDSSYSNRMMKTHWGDEAEGVLAHTRVQDLTTTDGKKMLFIEEIQSDWHNEGKKSGYYSEKEIAKLDALNAKAHELFLKVEDYSMEKTGSAGEWETIEKTPEGKKLLSEFKKAKAEYRKARDELHRKIPDAPFRNNYHEYVLKRLLRMASEEGYDSLGWTTADIQSKRWSDEYAEAYRIEYDQDIPSFLKKYGKKWGAKVDKTHLKGNEKAIADLQQDIEERKRLLDTEAYRDSNNPAVSAHTLRTGIANAKEKIKRLEALKVWSMDITDSMKNSVLYEGQVMYSERDNIGYHAGDLGKSKGDFLYGQGYGRDTGHFGSGTYFVGNKEQISTGNYGKRPHHAVDFSDYNLYKIKSNEDGWQLHDQLRVIDGGFSKEWLNAALNSEYSISNLRRDAYARYDKYYKESDYDTETGLAMTSNFYEAMFKAYTEVAQENNVDVLSYEEWSKTDGGELATWRDKYGYVEYLKEAFDNIDDEINRKYSRLREIIFPLQRRFGFRQTEQALRKVVQYQIDTESARRDYTKQLDSYATVFMKALGYEGVDVRGTQLDNTGFGSVIYDLKEGTVLYQDRDTESVSNRSLLANALESVAQNDIEKNKLKQYKDKIALIESEQAELAEIRGKIKELSFAKGKRDAEQIKSLQNEATRIANRINTYDRQLLNLESTTALKNVLQREKEMAYKKAEQRGKEALAKYREKASATQRELLTRYQESRKKGIEGRHKTEMKHKIKNVVSDLNKLLLNPTKEQHVPIGLQRVVAEALDAINMDTMNAEERVAYYNDLISKSSDPDEIAMLTKKRDFFEYRDMSFKDRITALKNAYAEFKESDDPLIRNAHNDAIEDLIKNTADLVGNKSLKDMSLEQLERVYDMYKAILATVRNSNKMFKEGRQATVTENSEAVKTEVAKVGGHKDRVNKIMKPIKQFGWNMLKPVTAMKVIGSDTFAKLFDNVRAGEDTWAVDVNEAKEFYQETAKKYNYKKWDFKKQHSFKDSRGNSFSLSLEQIMSLYAYSKRKQADKHLELGGFIFDDAIEVTEKKLGIPMKYEVNDANPYRINMEIMGEIASTLTEEQRAFADEMQAYLSDVMGEKGNEVSLAMYDIKLYNEKYYFPLKSSRYFREFDSEQGANPKIKNSGFSKKTVPQAGNPIVLSNFMDVWASHVNDMSMYHAFVLPLEDFMRVYNYSSTAGGYDSVQQYIKNAYGSQANQYIERLMVDLNGGARVDSTAGIINKGLALFKKASVFASASVVVQQPSAIARAFAYINPMYFVTSAPSAINLVKHKKVWAEIKKYAPVAVIKEMGYFDTGVGRSTIDWIKGNQTIKDKVDDALSKAPAMADELAWSYIWEAVKRETKAKTNLTVGTEEFLKKAGERFTEVIINTQVYDSVLSRSGMMRSKDTGMKMATAFMAEPTTTVNMMVDGIVQGIRGNKKFLASTVGAVSASIILNSILVSFVYAARDDDEDETYIEKYIGSLTTELIDGFNPLTYIPFVKDIWSIAQGYDVERSDMSVISDLWKTVEGLFSEDKSGWEKVVDVVGSVASLFGIPLKNIIRDAKGMYNLTETITSDTPTTSAGIGDSVEDSLKNSVPLWGRFNESETKSDKLYEAIMSGDQNQIERVKGQFEDEKAIESAMRQGLREHDPRIKEAAQARLDGDISEYTRIAREIIAEGNFSQDTVVSAINAEMTAIKNAQPSDPETTEEEEEKDEVTSIYKASDINTAFENGDNAMALEITQDLIDTKVANGMEEKNAKSSLRSSMTSYWKPLYKEAYQNGDTSEMYRIRQILLASGLYGNGNEVVKTVQNWLRD